MSSQSAEKAHTRNRRVARLLAVAEKYGWSVEYTYLRFSRSPDSECWTLRPQPNPEGYTLTVYPGRNHSATVYAELPGERDWSPISQSRAFGLIAQSGATA